MMKAFVSKGIFRVRIPTLAVMLFTALNGLAQSKPGCVLNNAANGQIVSFRATLDSTPHDAILKIEGCGESVIYLFAGDFDSGVPVSQLSRDRVTKRFRKLQSATYATTESGGMCGGCSKYHPITADFRGKLEIADLPAGATKDNLGRMWDSNHRFIGMYGWGHPVRRWRYRVIIYSASNVNAKKIPRPQ